MDPSFLPKQRRSARGEAGESADDMAEILRAWDDTDDEMVEFVQGSRELVTRQHDTDGLTFEEIDMSSERHGNGGAPRSRRRRTTQPIDAPSVVRRYQTFCLFVAFFGLGIAVAMLGPTLLDLAVNTSTSLQNMSYLFMARSVGFLIGSLVGGWLFDKFNSSLVLSVSCLLSALMMIIAPVGDIYLLAFSFFFMGNGLGSLDTGGNALILKLWETKSRPFMQALHFTFALGAFVSPLLVKPFLSTSSDTPNATIYHNVSTTAAALPSVTGAYWLGLLPLLAAGLGFLCCCCMNKCRMEEPISHISTAVQRNQLGRKTVILLLFFVFLMLYVGMEVAYGGYVFTFGVKSTLLMSKGDAAYLVSCFWGSFALSRLAAVPLSHYVRPSKLLLLDIIGCFLASAILASQFSGGCHFADTTKLWLGTVLLGISMASVFPSSISWAEYFIDVSGRTASVLVGGASFGEMALPLLVGNLFATTGPCVLMFATLIVSISVCLIFIAIFIFGKYLRKHSPSIEMHYQKKQEEPLMESQEDEVLRLLKPSNGSLLNDTDI